jgi:hypothetical protein
MGLSGGSVDEKMNGFAFDIRACEKAGAKPFTFSLEGRRKE